MGDVPGRLLSYPSHTVVNLKKNKLGNLGVVAHACNPSSFRAKGAGPVRSFVKGKDVQLSVLPALSSCWSGHHLPPFQSPSIRPRQDYYTGILRSVLECSLHTPNLFICTGRGSHLQLACTFSSRSALTVTSSPPTPPSSLLAYVSVSQTHMQTVSLVMYSGVSTHISQPLALQRQRNDHISSSWTTA